MSDREIDFLGPVQVTTNVKANNETTIPKKVWWKNLHVEIFTFLYMFGFSIGTTTNGNLYMDRSCLVNFNYTVEVCGNLSNYRDIKDEVQVESNNMNLYTTLIALVPGAIYAMFVGSWSDKYGRTPPIVFSVMGSILQDIAMLLFVYFDTLPVEYFMISFVPVALSGGLISILGMVYSLQSDKNQEANRTIKYALLEGFLFLAVPLSGLLAGQLFKFYGYLPVYGTGLVFHVLSLIFAIFLITDDRKNLIKSTPWAKAMDFFAVGTLRENFRVCMKKRPNNGRAQILALMPSGAVLILNYTSISSLVYLYANKMYDWDLPTYTNVSTAFTMSSVFAIIVTLPIFTRILKLSDAALVMIGITSMAAQNMTRAFAYAPWLFYTSFALGIFNGLAPLAFRSKMSKIVEGNELGKIFAVLAIFESLAPTPGTFLFTYVYNHTLKFFPGMVFVVAGSLMIYPAAVFIWLLTFASNKKQYENMDSTETDHPSDLEPSPTVQVKPN